VATVSVPIVVRLLRKGKTLVDFYFDPIFPRRVSIDEPVVIDEVTANQVGEALTPFVPTNRQFELMEHAIGGDSRHRNYFTAAGDDIAPWRELVAGGLAAAGVPGATSTTFYVSSAGLDLLDARARPRILEAKAAAWDSFRATFWEVFDRDDEDDGTLAETAKTFITDWEQANKGSTPTPKGPRAIAEDIVAALMFEGNLPITLASQAVTLMFGGHPAARENVTAAIAEIIRKALGGAS
jgi:hypothetical protein